MSGPLSTFDHEGSPAAIAARPGQPVGRIDIDALCAFVEARLRPWAGRRRMVITTVPAPSVAPESVLRTANPDLAVLWAPPRDPVFTGIGAACGIELQGSQSLDVLHREAARLWERVEEISHPDTQAPGPRLFGGLAFTAGAAAEPPWRAFGDGFFVLPRFTYCRHGERASLSVAVEGESLSSSAERRRLIAELGQTLTDMTEPQAPLLPAQASLASDQEPDGAALRFEEPAAARWIAQIEGIRRGISAGEFRKIVAARRLEVNLPRTVDGPGTLSRLGEQIPSSTRFAFVRQGRTFLGATPERLISRHGLEIETEALAGSISTEGNGGKQARRLLESRKDQFEHALVVRHIVERLEPLCRSLRWNEGPGIRELGDVLHLRTPIQGRLEAPTHVLRLVEALHPTPAVGGVPVEEALRWIVEEEAVARGWYAGPIGWFDAAGDGEFAVALRSGLLVENRAYLYAGAGIVLDSDPELEYLETEWKQRAILTALGVGQP